MSLQKQDYLRGDFKRALFTNRFLIGVAGVVFALFYSLHRMADIASVYTAYMDALYFIPFSVALIFCAVPFAGSFLEDIKHKYIQLLIMRGSLKKYLMSKIIMIYISSAFSMFFGIMLFIVLVRLQVPWALEDEYLYSDILTKVFWENGHHLIFFAIHALFIGLMAGNLAILAAYVSLFWQEELLTIALPFLVYYLIVYYEYGLFGNVAWLNIKQIFNISYDVWKHPLYTLLWPVCVSLVTIVSVGTGIYKKLGRLYDEEKNHL